MVPDWFAPTSATDNYVAALAPELQRVARPLLPYLVGPLELDIPPPNIDFMQHVEDDTVTRDAREEERREAATTTAGTATTTSSSSSSSLPRLRLEEGRPTLAALTTAGLLPISPSLEVLTYLSLYRSGLTTLEVIIVNEKKRKEKKERKKEKHALPRTHRHTHRQTHRQTHT